MHPYSFHCATCAKYTPHVRARHSSGETLWKCVKCDTWNPGARPARKLLKNPRLRGPTTAPRIYRGVYYWATYELARRFAENNGLPLNRIIQYERGWAVQLRVSGPYAGPNQLLENPRRRTVRGNEVQRAARLYQAFTGHRGNRVKRVSLPRTPRAALAVGPVLMIGYETVRDGRREKYVHRFAAHARPLLAASHDGQQVFMLGGAYTFTDRGIVDDKK